MAQKDVFLLPVGRFVQGSLYEPNTTDVEGRPLLSKSGTPRKSYFIAVAIEKRGETHWNQTQWGQKIWAKGHEGFPGGHANSPTFAWKITDGDSQIPNTKGNRPCDHEGFAKHWVVKFATSFAPSIFDKDTKPLLTPESVSPGDYIEVYGEVVDNGSMQQPGVFLHHTNVCFRAKGKRIVTGIDPKTIGFGVAPLPQNMILDNSNVALTPVSQLSSYQPTHSPQPSVLSQPVPHYGILTPPSPPPVVASPPQQTVRVMTPKAGGLTYDQYIAANWTDIQLIQEGMMVP